MNIDLLLQQLRHRSKDSRKRQTPNRRSTSGQQTKSRTRSRVATRRSLFQTLEDRRLLAADVHLNPAGTSLSITDTSDSDDNLTVEIASGNYVITSDSELTVTGVTDGNANPNIAQIPIGSINAIEVRTEGGDDRITLKNMSGESIDVYGGADYDTYVLENSFGDLSIVDSEGAIDLSAVSGKLTTSVSGSDRQIQTEGGDQVSFDTSGNFHVSAFSLNQTAIETALNDGLQGLKSFGDQLARFDAMSNDLPLLNGQSLGNFLPIGEIIETAITKATADYFAAVPANNGIFGGGLSVGFGGSISLPAPNAFGLVDRLNAIDISQYAGPGSLALTVNANVIATDDEITFDITLDATLTHADEALVIPDQILTLESTLENRLTAPSLTGDLIAEMQAELSFGIDKTSTPTFFAKFDSDLDASASIDDPNATFGIEAGLLGLTVGANSLGTSTSFIKLDAQTTINTTALGNVDGMLSTSELQGTTAINSLTPDSAAVAQADLEFHAQANGVTWVTGGGDATITYNDNGWNATTPAFAETFTSLGIDRFFNLDNDAVLQVMQQIGSYLNTLSLKAINTERILLGETKTFGDLVDIESLYRDEFLQRIELPPNVASTQLTSITKPEDDESLAAALGTSADFNPEFTITLRDSSKSFDVDVDGSTTLNDIANKILAAASGAGVSTANFDIVTDPTNGLIQLVDKTTASPDDSKFQVTAKQDGNGEDYRVAANLGLTTPATGQALVNGVATEYVIVLAPNPGANFTTLQEMLALPTGNSDGAPFTTISELKFDPTTSTFDFTVDISKTYADATDELLVPEFGVFGSLDTSGTLSLDDPTASISLPLQIRLDEIGFDTPLSPSTPISQLNDHQGVAIADGAADLRIHVADGRSFEVNLDQDLPATAMTALNDNAAIPTTGDNGDDLSITLNDGTTFEVDLDAPVDSSSAAPTNLGELVEAIQAAADAADPNLAGFALIDTRRGTLQLIDPTESTGPPAFAVTGTSALALGLDVAAVSRNTTGQAFFFIEQSLVVLDNYINAIEDAASDAGLNVAATNNFIEDWDFDVQIIGDGIVLADRTIQAAAISGTAIAGGATNELKVSGSFPSHADDALVGRSVVITSGTADGEILAIIGNTGDTLTLEAEWSTALDSSSQFEIANNLIVTSLGDSAARTGLGLATQVIDQTTTPATQLFDGEFGVGIRTTGNSDADLRITLSSLIVGAGTFFEVDLDSGGPLTTIADVGNRIKSAAQAAGISSDRFEVQHEQGRNALFLIDRGQAGAVGTFTATNLGSGSFAATDLGLTVGSAENVDVSTPTDTDQDPNEFVMEVKSPARNLGGSPLHGDTAAGHFQFTESTTPTIEVSVGIAAAGGTGTALYGPVAVEITDLAIDDAASQVTTSLTLDSASVSQLWKGLSNPFTWLVGDAVEFDNPLALTAKLKPVPSIAGIDGSLRTDLVIDAIDLYEVRGGVEVVTPSLPGSDDVQSLLMSAEQMTIADAFDALDSVSDYLLTLQTQSRLADRLPGLSSSVGELFVFGDRFLSKLNELKDLPDDLQPESIQQLASQLSAPIPGGTLATTLGYAPGSHRLSFEVGLGFDPIIAPVPFALDLTKLGLDLESLGLQKVASINDSLGTNPASVQSHGSIDVDLAIDLTDPANPMPLLAGKSGSDGTQASFDVTVANDDAFSFSTLLGSVPVSVRSGHFFLNSDGSATATDAAIYSASLQSDSPISELSQIESAASDSQTPVTIAGAMNATFDFVFPQQIIPSDAPTTAPRISVNVADVNSPATSTGLTTNLDAQPGNWPQFETLTGNFSFANSMNGFKLGFHELFTKLDSALDTTLLGRELPLVGHQLGDAADFLLQMRDSVVDNLNLYGDSTSIDSVRQSLFDAFGPGGFNWLQNDPNSGDSVINIEDVNVAIDVSAGSSALVTGVQFDLNLEMQSQALQAPVDLDLLLPSLGLETNAEADVKFGFKFPLSVGVSLADGVYLDVASQNDLEVSLDVNLPTASVTMKENPSLIFDTTSGTHPTVNRDQGNWILDGFHAGQIIAVDGSSENDGNYLVREIDSSGLVMTLELPNAALSETELSQVSVIQEGPTAGVRISVSELTPTGKPTLVFTNETRDAPGPLGFLTTIDVNDSITRSSGNWREDGFSEGDLIDVYGSTFNSGSHRVFHIDETGRILTVESVLQAESSSELVVKRTQSHAMAGRLGVLPMRIWDVNPEQSKLSGTFIIDWLDPAIIESKQRLSTHDLTGQSPFPIEPLRGFSAAPLPDIITVTESSTDPLTLQPISLMLETDLPRSAAFSPYRMQLDIENWDWQISDSLAKEMSAPDIAFNNVQFDLVGFTRDFLGPTITRLSESLDAADPILKFLQSEAMPILSLLFGRKAYSKTPAAFGGTTEEGNFVGASVAIRALARGGDPFERDLITETLADLFSSDEFDDITLQAIATLTGQQWIDIGNFVVDGAVARGGRGTLLDTAANVERELGSKNDASLRLSGSPDLMFTGNTINRQNVSLSGTMTFTNSILGLMISSPSLDSSQYGVGDTVIVSADGSVDGTYRVVGIIANSIIVNRSSGVPNIGSVTTSAALIGHARTWTQEGFEAGGLIEVIGGPNAGTYLIATVTDSQLTITGVPFPQTETVADARGIDIVGTTADGSRGGTIMGQIAGVARDRTSDAQPAALSFVTTQLIPGVTRLGAGLDILPVGVQRAIRTASSGSAGPIDLPILDHSFELLLGQTSFDGNDEKDSYLLSYSTPELSYLLYQMIPLKWELLLGKLIHPVVGTYIGKPLDSSSYVVPFISVAFEAKADYALAFDTTGLKRFGYTGNSDDILGGFFFDDFEGVEPNPSALGNLNAGAGSQSGASTGFGASGASTRRDEPQIRILGGIGAGLFLDPFLTLAGGKFKEFIQARAGFELSFYIGQDLNFNDPNGDGRVRAHEFDGLTDFTVDPLTGINSADGDEAFDNGLRLEVRLDVFASIRVGIFLTQKPPIFGLKIGFELFSIRLNVITIGFTIPLTSEDYDAPDLANLTGGVLTLVMSSTADNRVFVGATSAPDNQGRQDIVISGRGYYESFSGVQSVSGMGGSGHDFIFVMPNVFLAMNLSGGAGDDMIIGGSGPDTLTGGDGNDFIDGRRGDDTIYGDDAASLLTGLDVLIGGDGKDMIFGGGGRDVIRGLRDEDNIDGGSGDDIIDGGTGVDTIDGGQGVDHILGGIGRDMLTGGTGDDRIEGGRDADIIMGGTGQDLIFGGFGNDTIKGEADEDTLYGQQHNDTIDGGDDDDHIDGGLASDVLHGGSGDDLIISIDGNDVLDGQEGDDTYRVFYAEGKAESLIKLVESGPAEDTDVFFAIGTNFSDQFLLRASASGANAFVALLTDPDHSPKDAAYSPSVQRINYAGVERIVVNGGLDNDHFAIDDTSAEITINGESGEDSFQIGQLFRSQRTDTDANVSVDDVFATIETTRGFLSNGISQPMTINGGLGNDRFIVFHNKAVLSLNGDSGDDQFEVRAFALVGSREPERERTDITGGAGADLVQYAVNAPVNINGGDGFDTLTVIGTEFGDDFVVTEKGVYGAGLTINFTRIESLRVDGAEGNDRFFVKSTGETFITELFGGLGDDTFNMSGDAPPVVSNDLLGHSGIVAHSVLQSTDLRFEDLKVDGVSANVADNDEPFVVIRPSGGSSIVSETSTGDASFFDFYDIVLSRAPLVGFDVLVKALAPLPSPDRRAIGARAFRLTSPAIGSDEKVDGSVVTLRFTSENWSSPQRVEIRADGVTQTDTGGVFTRSELSQSAEFTYNDTAFEGEQPAIINHLVVSTAATAQGKAVGVVPQSTITIDTNRPTFEFIGRTIQVTNQGSNDVQTRRIVSARLVDGNVQLTVDRSWLEGTGVPNSNSAIEIDLDDAIINSGFVSAVNSTFTVPEPLDPFNPFLDSANDLLGRQVSIVDGPGVGQSRFITGAEATIGFVNNAANVFTPNVSTFSYDLTEGNQRVDATSGLTLRITALGDFDSSYENLEVSIDETVIGTVFNGSSGRLYQSTSASLQVSQSTLQDFLDNGQFDLSVKPSSSVNDFGSYYPTTSLKVEIAFSVDATSADFNKDIIGDLRLTLDRGWQPHDSPTTDSTYQIRVDDSLIGKLTGIDESPTGLPVDPSFPPELDTRTTLSDAAAAFDNSEFGPQGLRGATLEIVGGPGAGQQRLILGHLDANTLILGGGWNTAPVAGESLYRIARYDGLATASVSVTVNDNDEAGLIVDQRQGFDSQTAEKLVEDFDTITSVIEGGDGDQRGERDVILVKLARQPIGSVSVELQFDGVQLAIENVDGSPIAANTLAFDASNWDSNREVVLLGLHDTLREGFHSSKIKFVTTSIDIDKTASQVDQFLISTAQPVSLVGLTRQPSQITSVIYNNQTLTQYDPDVAAGTKTRPVWELISNQIVFHAGTEFTTVSGNSLEVNYDYLVTGFDSTFTTPITVRISDADAPAVLIRETGGSTDVVEGAAEFTQLEIGGGSFDNNSLLRRTVEIVSGTGVGQTAVVTDNIGNTLTLDRLWSVTPDLTSKLTISNDAAAGVSSLGEITGTMSGPFDRQSHVLSLVAGVNYTFDLEGSPTGKGTNPDPYLWVYDSQGRFLASNDDGGVGYNSRLNFTPSVSGNYTLLAGGYSFRFGSYTLTTGFSGDIAGSTSTTAKIFAPDSASSEIQFDGDQDWFAIYMQVGNSYTFDLQGSSSGNGTIVDPLLRLIDADGIEIETDDNSGTGNDAQITYMPTVTGTHYLSAQDAGSNTGTYRFSTSTIQTQYDVTRTGIDSLANDYYEVVLTAQPDKGSSASGEVRITVTPKVTKTSRTGGVRTDEKQVTIYSLDGLPSSRIEVDGDNLIVIFDETNWDQPVRIGVKAIDDAKVDGGDTKVFADGPNTVSRILGPVILDGAGGDGSLAGLGDPEKLPDETNVKAKTGDIDSIEGNQITLKPIDAIGLTQLDLESDLSDVAELIGKTIEVVATTPMTDWLQTFPGETTGNPNDPVVGQFRLITDAVVQAGEIVVTLNERFGIGGDTIGTIIPAVASTVELTITREQRLRLGLDSFPELTGRFLELTDADGALLVAAEITSAIDDGSGNVTVTVDADLTTETATASGFFIRSDDRIKSYAITSESLNFFVNETKSVDVVFVHDEDSPADSTGYLTENRLWGLNMGTEITVGGRLQAGGIGYNNLEVVQIDLGSGNNDFHVLGTHSRPDDPTTGIDETYQTWTFINSGDDIYWPPTNRKGDVVNVSLDAAATVVVDSTVTSSANTDQTSYTSLTDSTAPFGTNDSLAGFILTTTNNLGTVQTRTILGNSSDTVLLDGIWAELPVLGDEYEIINPADGAIAINTQDGDDVIDASGSTLGIVAFGGLGLDHITGGSGEDILLGDQGRVDYFGEADENGFRPIVTRLGEASEPIEGFVTGDFGNDSNLLDGSATFPTSGNFDTGLLGLYVDINNGTGFLQKPRLITANTGDSLDVSPAFTETLDLTSEYRVSTLPENQTDGVVRGANLIISLNDDQGDNDTIVGGGGQDQILGGAGEDTIDGGTGDDIILGDAGVIQRAAEIAIDDSVRTSILSLLESVQTKSPSDGAGDEITAGEGAKIIFGGAGDDTLLAGGDALPDVVLGDEGIANYDPATGLRLNVQTITPTIGGNDTISGGNAFNILLGGSGDDMITGGDFRDVILGDNGLVDFVAFDTDPSSLDQVITIDQTLGGIDTIFGGGDNDIIIGGTDDDIIHAGGGHDVVFGDHAEVDYSRPVDRNVISRFMTATDGGGNDTIDGDDGDDFIFGGQGDDTINGNAGQDDIVGGHNVVFGVDGDDIIDGGDGEDVILGDNGVIKRNLLSTQLGTWENYLAPFDTVVIRTPQPFDDQDLIQGDDTIRGGAGMDILRGQRGDDEIHGGDDSDEIIGGLGADTLYGDAGADFILADAGQILRDLNSDGTPNLNSDGTWHRDLLTESIGRVTNIIPADPAGFANLPADLADQLLDADHIVIGGLRLPSGIANLDFASGQWETMALLIENVGVDGATDDDIVNGGDGNDVILGQYGNDTIHGNDGDDTLIGDHGINTTPVDSDVPQMLDSIRIIGIDSGATTLLGASLVLPAFGQVIVPEMVAQPGDLFSTRPRWDRISPVNEDLAAIAAGDEITTTDDLRFSPSIGMTPTFIGHTEVLDGNDTISGDDGDDLVFGDKMIVTSDLQTGIAPIASAVERASASVAAAMFALEGLSLDRDVVRYEINGSPVAEATLRIGSDTLEGGDGHDTIVGDDGTFELPATHSLPGSGSVTENALNLQQHLADLETIGDDAIGLVTVAHLAVTEQLLADAVASRPSAPVITAATADYVQHHQLILGEDTVHGDSGNDTLLGGDGLFIAPVVSGTLGDLPESVLADGLNPADLVSLVEALDTQADAQQVELAERRDARSIDVAQELDRLTPLNRIAYVPSFDREIDNDTIHGGSGDDTVAGDDSVIATPLVLNAPTTSLELSDLDRHVELLLDQIATQDRSAAVTSFDNHIGRQRLRESATDAMVPESRMGAIDGDWEIGEDKIMGDDGADLLLGDHVAIVSPMMLDDVGRQVTLTRSAYGIGYLEDAMRSYLDNDALDRVDVDLSGDHIEGGEGNDVMLGSVGEDRLHGDDGDDTLRGGNERDVLIGGTGSNTIREDGGNYPNIELSQSLGAERFAATSDLTIQLYLDAASGFSMPVNWITSTTTTDSTGGETGNPDTPVPPVARTVILDPNTDPGAVIGQPVRFTAAMTDLPAGAVERFLWEVTDGAGTIVSVGQGPIFEFTPTQSGFYSVKATGTDNQNGLGESSIPIDVQNSRLIADPDQPGKSILVIGGTAGEDDIRLNDVRRSPDSVEVRIKNGGPWSLQIYENISRIDVYAGDGDDDVSGDKRLTIPLRLFGGAGNDKLRGSAASDFLSGGAGEDRLLGQDGDDVLIGGLGIDRLDGGDDDDLIISDDLASVYQKTDADSLMNRWSAATTSIVDRMDDLINDLSGAVSADGARDSLDGDDGTDWFFAQLSDEVRQRRGAIDVKSLF